MRRATVPAGVIAAACFVALCAPAVAADVPRCDEIPATVFGTSGPDHITGTSAVEVILALGGNDIIDGDLSDDTVCGGSGADTIEAEHIFVVNGDGGRIGSLSPAGMPPTRARWTAATAMTSCTTSGR